MRRLLRLLDRTVQDVAGLFLGYPEEEEEGSTHTRASWARNSPPGEARPGWVAYAFLFMLALVLLLMAGAG